MISHGVAIVGQGCQTVAHAVVSDAWRMIAAMPRLGPGCNAWGEAGLIFSSPIRHLITSGSHVGLLWWPMLHHAEHQPTPPKGSGQHRLLPLWSRGLLQFIRRSFQSRSRVVTCQFPVFAAGGRKRNVIQSCFSIRGHSNPEQAHRPVVRLC